MKANGIYTAIELMQAAGFEEPEKIIGSFKVVIAGVRGISKPDHLIKIQPGTKEIEVVGGLEVKKLNLEEAGDKVISDSARLALDKKPVHATRRELAKKAKEAAKSDKPAEAPKA